MSQPQTSIMRAANNSLFAPWTQGSQHRHHILNAIKTQSRQCGIVGLTFFRLQLHEDGGSCLLTLTITCFWKTQTHSQLLATVYFLNHGGKICDGTHELSPEVAALDSHL